MIALAASTLLACSLALGAASPGDLGATAPLGVRTQGSLRELFLDLTLSDARAVRDRQVELRWSMANDWSTPTRVVRGDREVELSTDEQSDALTLSFRLPWSALARGGGRLASAAARVSTSLEWRLTEHWGGWTDAAIEGWHAAINVFDFHRTSYPRGAVQLRLAEAGGVAVVDVSAPTFTWGDLVARTQVVLLRGAPAADGARERWAVALRLDVKAPLGPVSDGGGSGGWDAGAALVASGDLTPWLAAHAMAGLSAWSALPGGFPLRPRRWHGTAEASFVLHRGGWSLVLEDRLLSQAFEGGWEPALPASDPGARASAYVASFDWHNQVSVGVRRGRLTAWVSEDITPGLAYGRTAGWFFASNAPDVAVGLTWAQPF